MLRSFVAFLTLWLSASAVQAALTISITPIDETTFIFSASGDGSTTGINSDQGTLGFNANPSNALSPTFLSLSPGLTFGGNAVYGININQFGYMVVFITSGLPSSAAYSFSGGPVTGSVGNYASFFIPGTYNIDESTNFFGSTAAGALTIAPALAPIPEPSTYVAIAGFVGLGGFLIWRRQRAKK